MARKKSRRKTRKTRKTKRPKGGTLASRKLLIKELSKATKTINKAKSAIKRKA